MPNEARPSAAARREARRRALRRRRLRALFVVTLLAASGAAGAVVATRGDGAAAQPPPASPPATAAAEPVAATDALRTEQDAAVAAAKVTIAATGDIVMGTPTYGLPSDGGRTFFDGVDQELVGRDVVIGNLEGTLASGGSSKCGPASSNCFAFRTPPSYAKWLKRAGFTVMNLANNHSYDYGARGQQETLAALGRVGLESAGRPGQITIVDTGPVEVAVLGFAPYAWAQSLLDIDAAKRLVRKAGEQADVVVVGFHGGAEGPDKANVPNGVEYFAGENRGDVRAFAHAVVDAGADLVVGHGPHVLRGIEWYRDRLIAYSLGNFAGYGAFTLGGPRSIGAVLQVTLRGDGSWVSGRLAPTQLVGEGVPAMDPAERAHGIVRKLSRQDFGKRAVRLSPAGRLQPPR